jgi:hypothetical protein
MSEKQELVDICFDIAITMNMYPSGFKDKTREEIAEWVASQLKQCGFPTKPCGSSWGVLDKKNS